MAEGPPQPDAAWDEDEVWCRALIAESLATLDAIWANRAPEPGSASATELSPEEEGDGPPGAGTTPVPKLVDTNSLSRLQLYYGRNQRRSAHADHDADRAGDRDSERVRDHAPSASSYTALCYAATS